MYALFINTYDWYKWHDLIMVSTKKRSLVKEAKKIESDSCPLLSGKKQNDADRLENNHLEICKIKVI